MRFSLSRSTIFLLVGLLWAWTALATSEEAAHRDPAEVMVISLDSIIHPVAAEFVTESLEEADRVEAEVLILELNTPGGMLESTREITTAMLSAKTPVVVYVAPQGAQAASAGFFIVLAADVAAMAPGTNTGAAHPVGGQGEDIPGDMREKVEQDTAAYARSLATRSGRDVALSESAVMESRSFSAGEALESGLVDLVAPSLGQLLQELDGRELEKVEGDLRTLSTRDGPIRRLEMSPAKKFLSAIAHPNVAYILFSLGFLGLYFELSNPGSILPGVVGAICLILAFYAMSVLPLNYAGLALIGLGVLLFIAEIKVASFGVLTVGGVVSLFLGSLMLFKSPDPALRVSLSLVVGMTAFVAVTAVFLVGLVVRAHRQQVRTGSEGLVGRQAVARSDLDPRGKVFVHGEYWHATSEEPVASGENVIVTAVQGMELTVRPVVPKPNSQGDET